MTYQGKTDWQYNDLVTEEDLNRIEQGLQEVSESFEGTEQSVNEHLLDNSRHITSAERQAWNGKETPAGAQAKADVVQSGLNSHQNATNVHGATSAATANRIAIRDNNGRFKVANGSDAQDAINLSQLNGHTGNNTIHITSAERSNWNGKLNSTGGTINGNLNITGTARVNGHDIRHAGNTPQTRLNNGVFEVNDNGWKVVGGDMFGATPRWAAGSATIPANNTWTTAYSITGAGVIELQFSANATAGQVVIDGTTVIGNTGVNDFPRISDDGNFRFVRYPFRSSFSLSFRQGSTMQGSVSYRGMLYLK